MKRRFVWHQNVNHLLSKDFLTTLLYSAFCFPGGFVPLCQDRKIEELKQSLQRYKKVQDMVMSVQGKKGKK